MKKLGLEASLHVVVWRSLPYVMISRERRKPFADTAGRTKTDIRWWETRHREVERVFERCGVKVSATREGIQYKGPSVNWKRDGEVFSKKFLERLLAL